MEPTAQSKSSSSSSSSQQEIEQQQQQQIVNNNTNTQQVQEPPKSRGYQRMFKRLLHNRNSQPKAMVQERIIASYKVYGWLIHYDPAYESTAFRKEVLVAIDEIFEIVLAILDMMKCSNNLLIPIIIYADKFVYRSGIKHNQLFNLLLTSTVVSLKFWSESTQVNNAIVAEIFDFSLKDMNLMERRFLTGVDYNLFLNSNQVTNYLLQLYDNQQTFFSYFKHPIENPPQIVRKPFDLVQYQQAMIQQQQIAQLQMMQKQQLEQIELKHIIEIQKAQSFSNNYNNNNNNNNITTSNHSPSSANSTPCSSTTPSPPSYHPYGNNSTNHYKLNKKHITNQRYQTQQQQIQQQKQQIQQQQQQQQKPTTDESIYHQQNGSNSYHVVTVGQMVSPMC
ncbi:hypothetical protein CYY_005201 [Polysphondylium violaceum]|uniref:Cyclin N-terminal domain-containing protein n=1 Tax=Polysphondylium violaceum TaxID=133409 RepID=A0A8J4PTW7_9MYCE|nr:hypothetical protein CYY_005201 [Polysphondylium violaceum]